MTLAETKMQSPWREKTYPVPKVSRSGMRWKASALRGLQRWAPRSHANLLPLIMVPALYNRLPAETIAMGWLNEIDALGTIRQRMISVARKAGWDVFTFHTQHNLDHYYDSTIAAVRQTWVNEGSLSANAVDETKRQFGKVYDYHRIQPRLVENLVFQSSLMEWAAHHAEDLPFQFQVVGTALYSALVWSGSVTFDDALESALRVGARWDNAIQDLAGADASTADELGWRRFGVVQRVIYGEEQVSYAVARDDLPRVSAPLKPFWFSPSAEEDPVLVETARDARLALEELNLTSWASREVRPVRHSVRGLLVSPLHPLAGSCKWTVSNYLLSTPASLSMFMNHIAGIGRAPVMLMSPEVQNRLRLSRMKVTGP